jgi:hypothetical protein
MYCGGQKRYAQGKPTHGSALHDGATLPHAAVTSSYLEHLSCAAQTPVLLLTQGLPSPFSASAFCHVWQEGFHVCGRKVHSCVMQSLGGVEFGCPARPHALLLI